MAKTCNILAHAFSSLGVALLIVSCFLVPQHNAMGDDGGGGTATCATLTDPQGGKSCGNGGAQCTKADSTPGTCSMNANETSCDCQ